MKKETTTVYIANDGTRFDTEQDCISYENTLNKTIDDLPHYDLFTHNDYFDGCGFTYKAVYCASPTDAYMVEKWSKENTDLDLYKHIDASDVYDGWNIIVMEERQITGLLSLNQYMEGLIAGLADVYKMKKSEWS